MIQLQILSGKMAGDQVVARHFPFRVGRAPDSDLKLEEPGIWERHFEIGLRVPEFCLSTGKDTFVAINAQRQTEAVLKNGDVIEAGSVKIRFGLLPNTQPSLTWRESVTWIALVLLSLGQIALIYWLP
jgi:hypothetical protein